MLYKSEENRCETCACNMFNSRAAKYNRAPDNPVIKVQCNRAGDTSIAIWRVGTSLRGFGGRAAENEKRI